MSNVMLVCPEPLGHGQPAGIGIRFIEIARVLRGDGHAVTVLSPDAGAVEGCEAVALTAETLREVSTSADVAVLQGHVANAFFQVARPIPTVVDLYDPFIIENLHYFAERGDEVFRHDHATLMTSIARGDFFLCASEAQRHFYLGLFLAAGRLNPLLFERDPRLESILAIAPFGVQAAAPAGERDLRNPAILFGGIYDWYDPVAAIDAVAIARESIPTLTVTFTRHPNPDITPQGRLADAIAHAKKNRYDFVRFEPWAPYAQRAGFFSRFALALLTFPRSVETDLSMRTRVYDYLWAGIPIVTSPAPGTDEILLRYAAGSVIESGSPDDFARELVAILTDRLRYDAMSAGARRFIEEHQWSRTLEPLRAFCRSPRIDDTKDAFAPRAAELPPQPRSMLDRIRRRLRA
jgi:glycosyltransferase involved in cell wall biosynthesis